MKLRLSIGVLSCGVVVLGACGGGGSGGSSGGSQMTIVRASHGFGTLLPHTTSKADDDGLPTGEVIALDTMDKLLANVTPNNPVDPPVKWPETAILPTGNDGNHFIYVTFSSDIAVDSVLDNSPAGSVNSGLKGTISIVATDPLTGVTTPIRGRGFIGGKTYAGTPVGSPLTLPLQQWVVQAVGLDGLPTGEIDAAVVDAATPGLGFPGTEDDELFPDAGVMLSNRTFVYVRDEDGDLATHETFPQGVQVRMRISTGVLAANGKLLQSQGLACSTVGEDLINPELSQSPPPFSVPAITPGNGATGIDPTTNIRVEFTEPIQPTTLGSLLSGQPPVPSAAILVQFGPSTSIVSVPFAVVPASVFDLSTYDLVPAFNFPGAGPVSAECGTFNTVSVQVNAAQYRDLNDNQNSLSGNTFFSTGEGPGLVNAPVAPDVIYVGRFGSKPSISVIDLNGFGQGTGNPTYNPLKPIVKGNSNFPNNPNVLFQPSQLIPPLVPGDCTINGGSAGVFTIARDSSLNDTLITTPLIESVGDMALGHALDSSFNNGPPPLGCQSGGGNICAQSGKKTFQPLISGANTLSPGNLVTVTGGAVPVATTVGTENVISWGPHPNPPSLAFPPLCISPFIGGQEPTSIDTVQVLPGPTPTNIDNLLVPAAFPLGIPPTLPGDGGVPPNGLLSTEQNGWFAGPSPVSTTIATCQLYSIRQQVGHFLYVIDRIRREIVVLNSNRFSVIDRITVPDPTSLAISTNLNFLAVTNQSADLVSFIDIDPASSSFHTVVKAIKVGKGPRGIAWEPGNEDILVCNEAGGSVSLISAASLEVRKTLTNQLTQPFDVAITPRQQLHGFQRNLYFAYILNRDGSIAFFESGPNGLNGWGFDDVVGGPNFKFNKPKAIQPDHKRLASGCWIVHEDPLTPEGKLTGKKGGAVSNLIIESTTFGTIPLQIIGLSIPHLRDIDFAVHISVGPDQLTGLPVDLAFDNQKNFGGLVNETTPFSAGTPAQVNGKNLVRFPITGEINNIGNTNEPAFLFLAIPNSTQGGGVVEVIRMDSFLRLDTDPFLPDIQSIPVMGANILMDYFRQ